MLEQSEMYVAGFNDYLAENDCMFPTDLDYMTGWEDAEEQVKELEFEAAVEMKADLWEDKHQYFEA